MTSPLKTDAFVSNRLAGDIDGRPRILFMRRNIARNNLLFSSVLFFKFYPSLVKARLS